MNITTVRVVHIVMRSSCPPEAVSCRTRIPPKSKLRRNAAFWKPPRILLILGSRSDLWPSPLEMYIPVVASLPCWRHAVFCCTRLTQSEVVIFFILIFRRRLKVVLARRLRIPKVQNHCVFWRAAYSSHLLSRIVAFHRV